MTIALDLRRRPWHRRRVIRQRTIARPFSLRGPGLHTGRVARVTLRPAGAGSGRRLFVAGGAPVPFTVDHWRPSAMSTSVDVGDGRTVRTTEHLMAALSAYGIDNVDIEVDGAEIPILDGSARPWCRHLRQAGVAWLAAPRRAIRIVAPLQVAREGGFLRAEPGNGTTIDVTHDVLPAFPVMRWRGPVDAERFEAELAAARSFGNLHRRFGLRELPRPRPSADPPVVANVPEPGVPTTAAHWPIMAAREDGRAAPLLRGWRPWRAALVYHGRLLPWPRFADEPVRHVALDMIGDLALAGAPLIGRIVAHNPSHYKTTGFVMALLADPACFEWTEGL